MNNVILLKPNCQILNAIVLEKPYGNWANTKPNLTIFAVSSTMPKNWMQMIGMENNLDLLPVDSDSNLDLANVCMTRKWYCRLFVVVVVVVVGHAEPKLNKFIRCEVIVFSRG